MKLSEMAPPSILRSKEITTTLMGLPRLARTQESRIINPFLIRDPLPNNPHQ